MMLSLSDLSAQSVALSFAAGTGPSPRGWDVPVRPTPASGNSRASAGGSPGMARL